MTNETRKHIVFDNPDDLTWFEETYPKASLSRLVSMLLEKFRQAHVYTPDQYAEIAAREMMEDMKK